MKRKIEIVLFALLITIFLSSTAVRSSALAPAAVKAQAATPVTWNTFFGGVGTDSVTSTVVDSSGNIYVAGTGAGAWASVTPVRAYTAGEDAFVAKFDISGVLQWVTFLGGSGDDSAYDIALDDLRNVYVIGRAGNADWGTDSTSFLPPIVKSGVTYQGNIFVAKLDVDGALLWHTFAAYGGYIPHLVSDPDGNTFVTGSTMVAWGTPLNAWNGNVVSEVYVVKLDSSGSLLWHTFYGGGFSNASNDIALYDGSIYLTGEAYTNPGWDEPRWKFNGGLVSPVEGNPGHLYAFAARLDNAGSLEWYTFPRDSYNNSFYRFGSIALDSSGEIYTLGEREIVKINHVDGIKQWDKVDPVGTYLGDFVLMGAQIVLDQAGDIYMGGTSAYDWGLPATAYRGGAFPPGGIFDGDAFAAKFNSQGNLIWNTFRGSASFDTGTGLAVSPDGTIVLIGHSWSTWGNPLTAFAAYGSPPSYQGFLAKITPVYKKPLILVHGWLGLPGQGNEKCEDGIQRYNGKNSTLAMNNAPSSLADWLEGMGYEVWIAHLTTTFRNTPLLGINAECLKKQVGEVHLIYHEPLTIVAHSMGGLVSRLVIDDYDDDPGNEVKFSALYTIGSPHGGIPFNMEQFKNVFPDYYERICQAEGGAGCGMDAYKMTWFNSANPNLPNTNYTFIGGDAHGGTADIFRSFAGPNDGFVSKYSAIGWVHTPDITHLGFFPLDWTQYAPLAQFWTDEFHATGMDGLDMFSDSPPDSDHHNYYSLLSNNPEVYSHAFGCIRSKMLDEQTPPDYCVRPTAADQVLSTPFAFIGLKSGHLDAGQSFSVPTYIDGNGFTMLGLNSTRNTIQSFTLTRPDNQVIDPTYAAAHPDEVTYQTSSGTSTTSSSVYRFTTTQTGTWLLNITSTTQALDYTAFGLLETNRILTIDTAVATYHIGDTVAITARLENNGVGLVGATVTATLTRSDGVIDTLSLVDQADGTYSAPYIIPAVPGSLALVVTAGGSDNGTEFSRRESQVIGIASNDLQLTGVYSETPHDDDGDGLYEKLDFNAGVNLAAAGSYSVSADLYSGTQFVAHSGNSLDLTAGAQTITFSFDGVAIRDAGLNGPFTVTNLILIADALGTASQNVSNVLTTTAYTYTQFGKQYYNISGNTGIPGVTLNYMDKWSRTATSDENGDYSFSVPYHWSGTVTPYKMGYAFTPTSREYTGLQADQADQDYTATPITYTISGNTALGGVTLTYTSHDGTSQTTTSDSQGNYSLTLPFGWEGRITPSKAGATFTPDHISYGLSGNATGQDYEALVVATNTPTPTLTPTATATPTMTPIYNASNVVERVSLAGSSAEGNGTSYFPSISADGRYVAFSSTASNLVAGDTNNVEDVFVRDRLLGTTTRISMGLSGAEGNDYSWLPSISPDGRYIGFASNASNLVPNDTNGVFDTFLYDRQTGQTIRISVNSNGEEGNSYSDRPFVSPDGNYWVFKSQATNLVSDATNTWAAVFLYNQAANSLRLVSLPSGGQEEANNHSFRAAVSSGGRYVIYTSFASNLVPGDTNGVEDIFRYDTQTDTVIRISIDSNGQEANGASDWPVISADGRYVAFRSDASNLVSSDNNGMADTFVRDTVLNTTVRVSIGDNGQEGNGATYAFPAISADGRYAEFSSSASNLVPGDTNGATDLFLRDLQTGKLRRLSVDAAGTQANADSYSVSNGRAMFAANRPYLVYSSAASNLVPNDTNNAVDVFVVDWSVIMGWVSPTSTPVPTATPTPVSFDLYLHGSGATANPPTLFLNSTASTGTTTKYKDSAAVNFNGGNPWKDLGTWAAPPAQTNGQLTALNDLHVWLGLKNSDDIGTRFDLKAEVYKNGVLVSSGETRCVINLTNSANTAKEVVITFPSLPPFSMNGSTDSLSLKLQARVGTNSTGGLCGGHSSAVGVRLYFDSANRPAKFGLLRSQ